MLTFVSANFLRRAGLVGALVAATVTALHGDFVTAGGIIGSALSAAGLKTVTALHGDFVTAGGIIGSAPSAAGLKTDQ